MSRCIETVLGGGVVLFVLREMQRLKELSHLHMVAHVVSWKFFEIYHLISNGPLAL